ncbi:MAG: HAD hydrolase family protein [Acholeplasmatales bacterium]|jgi:hydroxymethylpyrimidine pyrophosphatase-like HAD family hydrolase|nr:HAD hydrolase family protein [Acholeplasmatales bacterium]
MKVYCFDLDGTILFKNNNNYHIYPQTIKLLKYLSSIPSNVLILSTGRMKVDNAQYAKIRKYFHFFGYLNGALIYKRNHLIKQYSFSKRQLQEIALYAQAHNIYTIFQGISKTYTMVNNNNINLEYYSDYNVLINDYQQILNKKISSISIITKDTFFTSFHGVRLYPWKLGGAHLLPNTNKSDLLDTFKDYQIITIGDGLNDLENLKKSDISIIYEDSPFVLRGIAKYICLQKDKLFDFYEEHDLL